jgi:hypothetical protein
MKAAEHATYGGWLIGFLEVTPAHTAPGILVHAPVGEPLQALWTPGVHYLVRQVPELDGAWARCLPRDLPLFMQAQDPEPPQPEAVLVTSPARFRDGEPEPPVPAWAPGPDGIGPHLLDADDEHIRLVLLEGYVYDIRDDLYGQLGRWSVNEWRPQTFDEMINNRFGP